MARRPLASSSSLSSLSPTPFCVNESREATWLHGAAWSEGRAKGGNAITAAVLDSLLPQVHPFEHSEEREQERAGRVRRRRRRRQRQRSPTARRPALLLVGPRGSGKRSAVAAAAAAAGVGLVELNFLLDVVGSKGSGGSAGHTLLDASKLREALTEAAASAPCVLHVRRFRALGTAGGGGDAGAAADGEEAASKMADALRAWSRNEDSGNGGGGNGGGGGGDSGIVLVCSAEASDDVCGAVRSCFFRELKMAAAEAEGGDIRARCFAHHATGLAGAGDAEGGDGDEVALEVGKRICARSAALTSMESRAVVAAAVAHSLWSAAAEAGDAAAGVAAARVGTKRQARGLAELTQWPALSSGGGGSATTPLAPVSTRFSDAMVAALLGGQGGGGGDEEDGVESKQSSARPVPAATIPIAEETWDKALAAVERAKSASGGGGGGGGGGGSKAGAVAKVPDVRWADVGGLGEAKDEINSMITLPMQHPELFASGAARRSGLLLFGPPVGFSLFQLCFV